jgi:HEAT repeat protein
MTEGNFAAEFKTEPFEAIRTLRVFVEFSLVTKVNATKWLFPLLLKARSELREHIYETLLHWEEPESILIAALAEYHKQGNEERLALAASLLADIGAPALAALRVLVRSGSPECEMFVPVIARLRGVSVQSRLALLAQVTSNPSTDVRYSLLEALRAFAPHEVIPLLRTLSRDEDEDIADEARAWLESLEAESQEG